MSEEEDKKNPWFGPKGMGFGVGPRSWQGWLVSLLGLIIVLTTITIAHDRWPYWFRAKTNGNGFNPATWQGWIAILAPIAIFLVVVLSIYFKQRKD